MRLGTGKDSGNPGLSPQDLAETVLSTPRSCSTEVPGAGCSSTNFRPSWAEGCSWGHYPHPNPALVDSAHA